MDKNRRSFFGWLAGFLGLGAVASASNVVAAVPQQKKSKGFICLTLNVGQLAPYKAEAYIERVKAKWKENDLRQALDDWEIVIIPVRPPQETKIEIFASSGNSNLDGYFTIEKMKAQRLIRDDTPFDFPDKKLTLDYVQLMLGAPVVKIELDATQIDACYDQTKELFDRVAKAKGIGTLNRDGMGQEVFKNIVVAKATIMLGHIRRKYQEVPGTEMVLDGDEMVNEGNENLIYWTQYIDSI